ncbi:MAG: alpha/beta fold hydrolase [Proteobacteria bacterium]|nr:alpha/beta fold hydrolase [Pseudomonadota bacterium]
MDKDVEDTSLPVRVGPRPLALHLGLATTTVAGSLAALPIQKEGEFPWTVPLDGEAVDVAEKIKALAPADMLQALSLKGGEMVQEMIDGIHLYHQHSYRRPARERPTLWSAGTTSLLDCNPEASDTAPTLLIVPSLVNRSYVLDLMPGRSLVDFLAEQGIRPLLLDWDKPGKIEKDFNLENYIQERISPAIDFATNHFAKGDLHLAGYCMGGTLAVPAAIQKQELISSFVALASPWNFHAGLSAQAKMLLEQEALWATVLEGFGELPVDLLQTLFTSLDPNLGLRKFSAFSKMKMETDRAIEFVALEDWLNDGIPLVKKVTEECFHDWYGNNDPYRGHWRIGGEIVDCQKLTIPALIAVPKADKIVPRPSALAMAEKMPNAKIITPPSGHIGMITSSRAKSGLWQELSDWILSC